MTRKRTAGLIGVAALVAGWTAHAGPEDPRKLRRISTQFIAALGDPSASSGSGAETWGLWKVDPGPRGVRLDRFERLKETNGRTPAQWQFDAEDWWLEERGVIMEKPEFPLAPGQYVVTGDREVTTILTVHPPDAAGAQRWELEGGAKLYDVTHLPCRSARYVPLAEGGACSPENAERSAFPVTPGGPMPSVAGCSKQDYAVLFVIGVAVDD